MNDAVRLSDYECWCGRADGVDFIERRKATSADTIIKYLRRSTDVQLPSDVSDAVQAATARSVDTILKELAK